MTPQQTQILTAAKDWIGTPYLHQASVKHHGCDCLGFIRGLWRDTIGLQPLKRDPNPRLPTRPIGRNGGYGARELLWNAALRHLTPIKPINPNHTGDIILLRMMQSASAKHLAVLADANGGFQTIIHAYSGVGVVETPLTPSWQRRIVAQFRFPERS